jgi:hypothetical protein
MKRINFFATKDDLLYVLRNLEVSRPIKYTRAGQLIGLVPEIWKSGNDLPQLGKATGDQAVACDPFLIIEEGSSVQIESRSMFNGQERFDVDQSMNPDSVVLLPGGQWIDGAIISGSIATISTSPTSQALMRSAHSAVKQHFTRVRAFWVGPEALVALRSGKRLTYAIQSPSDFDLHEVDGARAL